MKSAASESGWRGWRRWPGAIALLSLALLGGSGCERPVDVPEIGAGALDASLARTVGEARARVMAEPKSGEAWGRLGQAFEAAEFHEQARLCYERAIGLDAGSARWAHLLGLLAMQDRPEAGLRLLERAVERAPSSNDAPRLRLAQALVERGRFTEATQHLGVLLAGRTDHPAARLEWARVRLAEGRLESAKDLLAPCVTNPFTARPALLLLSQVRGREGAIEEAATLARRAASMPKGFDWPDPYLREVQSLRSDRAKLADQVNGLLMARRFDEARGALRELLGRFPEDPEFLLLSGRIELQERRCGEAERWFREHLRISPNSLNGWIQLSIALLCLERWPEAVETLEKTLALKPDFAQAHANLGLAKARTGDWAGAIRSYREALRCQPGEAAHHASLAEALASAGRLDEAWEEVERALAIDPRHPKATAWQQRLRDR